MFMFLSFCLFFCLAFLSPTVVSAGNEDMSRRVVKIGLYEYPLYAECDSNGVWTGYDAEMTENIAQNAGFSVEFVSIHSYDDAEAGLADGTLDMVADMTKTSDREEKYLFSDYEIGSAGMNAVVKKENDTVNYGDIVQLGKLTYALLVKSVPSESFQKWCAAHGVSPKIIIYPDVNSIQDAIDSGLVDATVLTDDTAGSGKYRTVLSFGRNSYYFIFRKNDTSLKNQVDEAAEKIFLRDPLYEQTLRQKYGISVDSQLSLTSQEKEYIASHPDVTVAVVENDEPYYKTGKNGKAEGVLPDLYMEISRIIGIKISYSVYDTQEEETEAVLQGKADVLGLYSDGLPYAYSKGFRLTSIYSNVNLVMITRTGTAAKYIKTIAMKARSLDAVRECVAAETANAEILPCTSAADCFTALKNRSADALIVALPSATWLMNQTSSSAYSFVPLSGRGIDLSGALCYGNATLSEILSKGILQTADLFNGIVSNNTGPGNSLAVLVAKIPAASIIIFGAVMVCIILFLVWALFILIRNRQTKIAVMKAEAAAEEQRIKAEAVEKSAMEKNAFFSNISHDMRTPLNGILGFANLAEKQTSVEKARVYIAKIKLSGNLLLSLINDTLTISKISNGKLELHPEPVSTDDLTEGITDSISTLAAQKEIDFIIDDSGLRSRILLADKLNLEKIFLNLLSNAVKFTPEGGHVRFTVRDAEEGKPDSDIIAIVSDDGIGMSEDYMKHMYEPFSQEKRHGYDSVGTGLGLSIVQQLVNLMGGTIEADSSVGEGTVITVRLHFQNAVQNKTKDHSVLTQNANHSLSGKKILLCEDNMLNREIAAALLKDKAMSVVIAENGMVGTELFSGSREGEFAAILMDIRMPVMDGLEATRTIRALDRADAKTVPILAMTADAFAEDREKCFAAGMNAHIAKPIDPQKFYQTLRDFIASP